MVSEYEKHIIEETLKECGSAAEAARLLRIDKSTMSKKRRKYGI